jgi:hypothetical protein
VTFFNTVRSGYDTVSLPLCYYIARRRLAALFCCCALVGGCTGAGWVLKFTNAGVKYQGAELSTDVEFSYSPITSNSTIVNALGGSNSSSTTPESSSSTIRK